MTREEAIKIIDCYDINFYDLSGEKIPANKLAEAFDMAIEALSERTGEWEVLSPAIIYKCPECGQIVKARNIKAYKLCHGCGADMRGKNNEA